MPEQHINEERESVLINPWFYLLLSLNISETKNPTVFTAGPIISLSVSYSEVVKCAKCDFMAEGASSVAQLITTMVLGWC